MGMFGGNRLAILGAAFKDAGAALQGRESDALVQLQAMLAQRQQKAAQQSFLQDLAGRLAPQYEDGPQLRVSTPNVTGGMQEAGNVDTWQYQSPRKVSDGLNINSPELPALALQARALNMPLTDLLDVLKAQQPDVRFDRGFGYNGKTGQTMGGYHPDLGQGVQPTANGGAEAVPGYAAALAGIEGAKTGAQEQQKAAYDLVDVPLPDGRTVKLPRLMAGQILSQSVGQGGVPAGLGVSQTPAEASAAKIVGDAQATAQTTLPTDLNTIDTAIETAAQLKSHPALDKRTGAWSMLPAIPGTAGASFEAYKKQVLGQGWLDARQALKGGGPITDYEGKKAEQAKMRMDAAQTPEAFKAALDDYVASLQRARTLMQQKAGVPGARLPQGPRTQYRGARIISVE